MNQQNMEQNKNYETKNETNKNKSVRFALNFDENVKATQPADQSENTANQQNIPGIRRSARVLQKRKLNSADELTPAKTERVRNKKNESEANKTTTSQLLHSHRTTWTNLERNYFFDALNEHGKDFEAISNYINGKLKRCGTWQVFHFKTKQQVYLHYYWTYKKICKYIRYTNEITKTAQELYTLINYGEMRRKLEFLKEKHFLKLRQLVYRGNVIVRFKGKNVRIKTPACIALYRLNQLDNIFKDLRLPAKIEVSLTPANMQAFVRVQSIAQNPNVRVTIPPHQKLVNFIKAFQYKWRSYNTKLAEEEQKLFPSANEKCTTKPKTNENAENTEICFRPKSGVQIDRPLLSITEYLSNVNICLNAYEERMGVKMHSETISSERNAANQVNLSKRQRTGSGTQGKLKRVKQQSPVLDEQLINEDHAATREVEINNVEPKSSGNYTTVFGATTMPNNFDSGNNSNKSSRNSLLNDDSINIIREGWTISKANDIILGDLYVVLGQDSKLELEYYWQGETPTATSSISNKLKHLVMIANLSERMRKRPCHCGHICERNATKVRINRDHTESCHISNNVVVSSERVVSDEKVSFPQAIEPVSRSAAIIIDPVARQLFSRKHNMAVQRPLIVSGCKQTNYDLHGFVGSDITDNNHPTIVNDSDELNTKVILTEPLSTQNLDKNFSNSTALHDTTTASMLDSNATSAEIYTTCTTHFGNYTQNYASNNIVEEDVFPITGMTENDHDESITKFLNSLSEILDDSSCDKRSFDEYLNDYSLSSLLENLQ